LSWLFLPDGNAGRCAACLSTWLNAGVDPTQAAEWAGNSIDVLLRVYAKCIHSSDQLNRQRIEGALRGNGDDGRQ
jgi:hypothetical protein